MAATHFSGPLALGSASQKALTGNYTVNPVEDNGITFLLNATGGGAITLPAHRAGFTCKFIVKILFSTDWVISTITADDDTIEGVILVDAGTLNVDAADSVTFANGADNIGDWVTFTSDGEVWYVTGQGDQSVSITSTG